jgi:hypothetical protein
MALNGERKLREPKNDVQTSNWKNPLWWVVGMASPIGELHWCVGLLPLALQKEMLGDRESFKTKI